MNESKQDQFERFLREVARAQRQGGEESISAELLTEYIEGRLSKEKVDQIERVLAQNSELRQLIATLREVESEQVRCPLRMPAHLKAKLIQTYSPRERSSLVQLAYDFGKGVLDLVSMPMELQALQPAMVRGAVKEAQAFQLKLGDYDLVVRVDQQSNGLNEIWVRAERNKAGVQRCEWLLYADEKLIEQQPGCDGEALFADLERGFYTCALKVNGVEQEAFVIHLRHDEET